MKKILKKTGWIDIVIAIILAIIGTFMIIKTDSAIKIMSYVLGGIFIVFGIIRVIDYFIAKGDYDFYNYDLVYGIVAIILGLITILCSGLIEYMFRIMIGFWIIYSGVLRLNLSLKLRRVKVGIWSLSLVLSLIMVLGGFYILLQKGALVLTLGIIILIYAIIDLIESIIFMKYVNKLV